MVSGIANKVNKYWKIMKNAKNKNINPGLLSEDKKLGIRRVINDARIQWTEIPKDRPFALKLLGKISAVKTHIILPWPIAWEAININRNKGTKNPSKLYINEIAIIEREIIYPNEPIFNKDLRPVLSIKYIPIIVKIKFIKPIPILLKNAELDSNPAISKILGA